MAKLLEEMSHDRDSAGGEPEIRSHQLDGYFVISIIGRTVR